MADQLSCSLTLTCWRGDRGTYHLVTIDGDQAEHIATHATFHRMEFGRHRGFGSVKVIAKIGETEWKTSVFPQDKSREWVLLVSKKVMRAERLAKGDSINLTLELL